ncbi:MAG: stage II sporulation protein P [Huintestinicola sp.]
MDEYNRGFYHVPRKDESDTQYRQRQERNDLRRKIGTAAAGLMMLAGAKLIMDKELPEKAVIFPAAEQISSVIGRLSLISAELCMISPPEKAAGDEIRQEDYSLSIIYDDSMMITDGSSRIPSSANEQLYSDELLLPPPSADDSGEVPYPDSVDSDGGPITEVTYGYYTGTSYIDLDGMGQIRNLTSRSNEEVLSAAMSPMDFSVETGTGPDEPQILIMHTHTTECYEPYRRSSYDPDFLSRTTDSSKNMTAVGEAMARIFEARGISTLHDTTVHDHPSYNGSYDRSRETVTALLKKYPSIKVVLDVHRDAIERENGERIAPTAEINGRSSAQVMLICGCDDGTMGMPDCMKNLAAAGAFQRAMESRYNGLTRPVLFDYRQYNQDLTTGSLLIEVGGHANSLDQALYAGELAAEGIADALIGE